MIAMFLVLLKLSIIVLGLIAVWLIGNLLFPVHKD